MRCFSPACFAIVVCCVVTGMLVAPALSDDQFGTSRYDAPATAARGMISQAELDPPPASPLPPIAQRSTTASPQRPAPRFGAAGAVYTQPVMEPQVTNQTRQALGFYGGSSARATLSQFPRRTPIQPSAPRMVRRQAKPFQNVERDPTISPYLHLDREEDESQGIPNYFTFVRPQIEQLQTNRMQQRDIQQLRGQLQSMSSTVVGPQYQAGPAAGVSTPARFMDTAQFYGGLR
jgi:hypothetical protein